MLILILLSILFFFNSYNNLYAEDLVLKSINETDLKECSSIFTAKDDSDPIGIDFKDKRNILASDLMSKASDLLDLVRFIRVGIEFNPERISKSESQLIWNILEKIYYQFYHKPLKTSNKKIIYTSIENRFISEWLNSLLEYLDQIEDKIQKAKSDGLENKESIRYKLSLIDKIEGISKDSSSTESTKTKSVDDIYEDIEGILVLFSTGKKNLSHLVHYESFNLLDKEKKVLKKILPELSKKYLHSNLDLKSLYMNYINDYIVASILDSIDKLNPREFMRFLAVEDNSLVTNLGSSPHRYRGKRLQNFLNLIDFDPRVQDYCFKNSFILRVYKSIISNTTEISYPIELISSQIKRKDRSNFDLIYQKVLNNLNSQNYPSSLETSDSKLTGLILATKIWSKLNPKLSILEALKNNTIENISKIFSTLSSKDKLSFSWIISVDPSISQSNKVTLALAMISSIDISKDEQVLVWQITHSPINQAMSETLDSTTRRLISVFDYELFLKISDLFKTMSHQELIRMKLQTYLKDSESFDDSLEGKSIENILKKLIPSIRMH